MKSLSTDVIGKYVNRHLFTDIQPIGKIIAIKGKSTIVLAEVNSELDPSWKPDCVAGGFFCNVTNNDEQKHIFSVNNDTTFELRWSKAAAKQYRIADEPRCFYDYNF